MPSISELIRVESLISQFGPKEAFSKLEMVEKVEKIGY